MSSRLFYTIIVSVLVALAIADYFQLFFFAPERPPDFLGSPVKFLGVIVAEPEAREFNTRVLVQVSRGGLTTPDELVGKKILVTLDRYSPVTYSYGDELDVNGVLELPENFTGQTGREFDYVNYLASKGVSFQAKMPRVQVVGHDPPSRIIAALITIKQAFVRRIESALSEPQSSLASGILIDGKRAVNASMQEEFKRAGIVHIVVLSGYNVTVVVDAIFKMFTLFLPRLASIGAAAGGVILFALMTGATSTVIRASVMALLALLSRANFKNYDPGRALFLAALIMVLFNPRLLLHDPSFQLSCLATFGVIFIVPVYEKFFRWLPERFGLREFVGSTVIVQFFLLPLLIYMSGTVSLVALPVNFIVTPVVPAAMLASFVMTCAAFLFVGPAHILVMPFSFLAHGILSYILFVAHFSSSLSFAQIDVGNLSGFFMILAYAGIGVGTRWLYKNSQKII